MTIRTEERSYQRKKDLFVDYISVWHAFRTIIRWPATYDGDELRVVDLDGFINLLHLFNEFRVHPARDEALAKERLLSHLETFCCAKSLTVEVGELGLHFVAEEQLNYDIHMMTRVGLLVVRSFEPINYME